jgi:hypothetical protein
VLVWPLLVAMTLAPPQRVREDRPIVPKGEDWLAALDDFRNWLIREAA